MARLDGTSLFTSVSSGFNNTYSILSKSFSNGITLENLASKTANDAMTQNGATSNFKSYLSTNFNSFDKNHDGKITADELQNFTNQMSMQGMTREQLTQLGATSGMSSSLLDTVTRYFDEIDTNKDGRVSNAEIQAFGVKSDVEKKKQDDLDKRISNMSTFYETSSASSGSLLDYKYLSDNEA